MDWENLKRQFYINFIEEDRWRFLTSGLANTLQITLLAVLLGIVIGVVVAIVRSTYDKTIGETWGMGRFFLRLAGLSDRHSRYSGGGAADDYVLHYLRLLPQRRGGGDSGFRCQLWSICGGNIPGRNHVH